MDPLSFYSLAAIITSTLALYITYLPFSRHWRRGENDRNIGPPRTLKKPPEEAVIKTTNGNLNSNNSVTNDPIATEERGRSKDNREKSSINAGNDGWKCACEGGGLFLPPNLMRSLGGPGAALRLGAGGCYHKQL